MSDFYNEKEYILPCKNTAFQRKKHMSGTLVSAIDSLLCPSGNMFTSALTVKNLMELENLSVSQAAQQLCIKQTDVANKLRLFEYSEYEKALILELELTEKSAVKLLNVDKAERKEILEECKSQSLKSNIANRYITEVLNGYKPKPEREQKGTRRKFSVCDEGFLLNSLDRVLSVAKQAGLQLESNREEKDDCFVMNIMVKKRRHSKHVPKVDKPCEK